MVMGFWPRPHVIWKLFWKPLGTVYSAHVLQREISLFLVCVAGIMMQSQQADDRRKLTLCYRLNVFLVICKVSCKS